MTWGQTFNDYHYWVGGLGRGKYLNTYLGKRPDGYGRFRIYYSTSWDEITQIAGKLFVVKPGTEKEGFEPSFPVKDGG